MKNLVRKVDNLMIRERGWFAVMCSLGVLWWMSVNFGIMFQNIGGAF